MKLLETAFFFLFLIKYTYQSCGILTDYGNIKPEALDVEVNSDIVFTCSLNSKYHYNSSSIFFTLHNTDISKWSQIKIIDNLTAQLTVPKAQANQSGRYYCKVRNETNNSNLMVCVSEARVGRKPQDIPVKDLSCRYLYRQELKCQWAKPRNNIQTDVDFYRYNEPMIGFAKHCPLRDEHVDEGTDKTIQSCTWNKRTTERATYSLKYHFELNMRNALGAQQQFFVFNLSSIVQLDAPPNFTFNAELSTLAWDYPNLIDNDINLFPLLTFKVLVSEMCEHSDECLDNKPNVYILENTRKSLKLDLKPYTLYNFSISCKVNDDSNEYWSSFSHLKNVRTKGAAPQSPPRLISQAFETSSTKSRSATIYWQPLPSYLKNSPSVTYLVIQLDNKHQVQSNRSTSFTNLTYDSLDSTLYEFRIYSSNSFGISREYSSIILPHSSDILQPPKKIAVIAQSSSDYEMEWEKSDLKLLQNYTVFWCVAKNDHCVEGIQWKFLQSNNFTLSLPPNNYKFGVSLNTQHSTSGIYWTHCIVNPKTKIDKLRTVHPFTHGANSILIKWDFLCDAQKRLVPDMRIEFCPKEECTPDNTRILKVEDLSTSQFMVNDLSPNVTYSFVISSANIAEASHIYGTTDNGVPPPPFNVRILERTDNMSIIEWNFVPNVVDHFRVKAPFLTQDVIEPEAGCNTTEQCNTMLVFSKPLAPYVNYSIAVSACNTKDDCSNSSQAFFQTAPARPGKMLVPANERINSTHYRVYLRKPMEPNGPIDFYYIFTKNKEMKRYNTSETFVNLPLECDKTEKAFNIKIVASNLVNGEELRGEPTDVSIDYCKQYTGGLLALFIVVGILLFILMIIIIYYVAKSMNNLKLKKKGFQLNIQCNQRETDLPFEQGEKDSLVHPEENEFNNVIITERRKISSSVTNASMTSDSSIAENSHSSDKIPSSSSDNCYNSDSTANYSDVNYRENHEYFLNAMDDSYRPLMAASSEVDADTTPAEPCLSSAPPLDMDKASELNKTPASYIPAENVVFVPLSPMPAPASPPASLTSTHSHSQYISHDQIAAFKQSPTASKFPNLRSSTNC